MAGLRRSTCVAITKRVHCRAMDSDAEVRPVDALAERLRRRILNGVHRGQLHAGDRLPSSRELGEELAVDHRAVAKAYRRLAAGGMVELRPRSGVYLSSGVPGCGEDSKVGHNALWMRDIATEAWLRRVPLRELAPLVRRFLSSRVLRALCIESALDPLLAVQFELEHDFGLEVGTAMAPPAAVPGQPRRDWAAEIRAEGGASDLIITNAFLHDEVAEAVAGLAEPPDVVQFTLNQDWLLRLQRAMEEGGLLVVAVDPASEDRFRIALEVGPEDDFRFVTVDAWRTEPPRATTLYATHAARGRDPELAGRSLPSLPPVLSMETARALAAAIVVRQVSG